MSRRRGAPRAGRELGASALVGQVLDKYRVRGDVSASAAVQAWPEIVGDRIAARAWPYHIRDGVLLVAVSSSSWLHQLAFIKGDIVQQLNARAGEELVREVRFELAGRLEKPGGVSSQVLRPPPRRRPKQPPPPASGERLQAIERDAEAVDDPELRELIAKTRKRWDL